MAEIQIEYKLDLIVHLVDTTTGEPISQKQVIFHEDGHVLTLLQRNAGFYVLLNHGRTDTQIAVDAEGYLPSVVDVCYSDLSEKYPQIDIPMIPKIKDYGYIDMITMEGQLPGLESVDAVPLKQQYGKIEAYLTKKQVLKLFKAKLLGEQSYAVVHEEQMEFEEFRIAKKTNDCSLKLKEPLVTACRPEEGITRIVRGKVDKDGNYLLRVREDVDGAVYIVRYVVKGNTKYKRIAFDNPEERRLE